MNPRMRDICKGSGRVLDQLTVRNSLIGRMEILYGCPVCQAYLRPLINGGSRPHVNWNERNRRLRAEVGTHD